MTNIIANTEDVLMTDVDEEKREIDDKHVLPKVDNRIVIFRTMDNKDIGMPIEHAKMCTMIKDMVNGIHIYHIYIQIHKSMLIFICIR